MTLTNEKGDDGWGEKKKKKRLTFYYTIVTWFRVAISSRISTESKFPNRSIHKKYDMQRLAGVLLFELSFVRFQNRTYLTTLVVKRNRVENGRRNGVSDPRMPNCKLKSGIVRGGCRITKGYSSLWTWPNSANGRGNFGQWPDLPTRRYVFFYTKEETGNPSFLSFIWIDYEERKMEIGWMERGWMVDSFGWWNG